MEDKLIIFINVYGCIIEEAKMRVLLLMLFLSVLMFSLASHNVLAQDRNSGVQVTVLNQDPYPAEPNNYVDIVFKVENKKNLAVNDFLIELLPQYPFSLDSSGVKEIGTLGIGQYDDKAVYVKYKVRVDKDAIDGENEIKVRYVYDTNGEWRNYITQDFNITIEDPKTDFDVAVQDYSFKTNTLTLAVSNIGKKNAQSVTVSLPGQSSIDIIGSDKNILGGIDTNDYTIASFKVISKQDGPLVVRIAYTDSIGIRREVEKAVIFKASSYEVSTNNNAKTTDYRALIYIAIGVIGIIVIFVLLRIFRKKRKVKQS